MRIIIEFDERSMQPTQPEVQMQPTGAPAPPTPPVAETVETVDAGAADLSTMSDVSGMPSDVLELTTPSTVSEGESAGAAPEIMPEGEIS